MRKRKTIAQQSFSQRQNFAQPANNMQKQNQTNTPGYQPNPLQNETLLPYYLQQHEITKTQRTKFTNIPNTAESHQMTINPNLMSKSSITSNKPLIVFREKLPEHSVED